MTNLLEQVIVTPLHPGAQVPGWLLIIECTLFLYPPHSLSHLQSLSLACGFLLREEELFVLQSEASHSHSL